MRQQQPNKKHSGGRHPLGNNYILAVALPPHSWGHKWKKGIEMADEDNLSNVYSNDASPTPNYSCSRENSGKIFAVVMVWVCPHVPIHNIWRCSKAYYIMAWIRNVVWRDSMVALFPHSWHHLGYRISASFHKSEETHVVEMVWVCPHVLIHNM